MTSGHRPETGLRAALPLVIAGFVISFVVVGGGIDTVSVFLNAIAKATDWSRSGLSLGVSVGALSAALSTPLVGIAVDRFGVRVPMIIGVALLGLGFSVLVMMNQPWHFVAANVALGAGFAGCALLPITVAVTVQVPGQTALALGIVGAGSSAGAFVLAPAVQAVIEAIGWRNTYLVMGMAIVLTPLPFLLFALPRGRLRREAPTVSHTQSSVGRELRRPGVAPLAAIMILPGLASFSISVHVVPLLAGLGHAGTIAAAALGAAVGISAIGKIAGGFIADRFGPLPTVRLAFVVWVGALALLAKATTLPVLGLFVLLYGLALGTQLAVIPVIAVSVLEAERFGTLFGLLQLVAMLASAVGPVASGLIFDRTGGYGGAIGLWIAAMIGAAIISFRMVAADGTALRVGPRKAVA